MIKIPNTPGAFKQVGTSDVLGTFWSSFNLDLTSNIGRLRISPRGIVVDNSVSLATLTTPVAFRLFATNSSDQHIWAIAGKMFFNAGRPSDNFIEDGRVDTPAVGNGSDMELFNGALYVVGTAKIMKLDSSSSWSEVGSDEGTPVTSCCVYAGRLYYSNNSSQISSIDLADTISNSNGTPNEIPYTLQLADYGAGTSASNTITSIRASSNRIWIATVDKTSQNYSAGRAGKVFEWDGVSTQANKVYTLNSVGALALIIKDDTPYVVDADGKLLGFNGSAFTEIARLPIPPNQYLKNPTNSVTQKFIHPRGIAIKNNRINFLINNIVDNNDGTIIENLPSGVWEYDIDMGLYHKFSLSQWKNGSTYQSDYGQNRLLEVGALFDAKSTNNSSTLNGDLLLGAKYYNDTSLSYFGIFINDTKDTVPKIGYFVTTKIDSQNITDVWQKVYAIYKQFLDASDKIIIKYRTIEQEPVEGVIDWTSSTTFTTSLDLSSYSKGDEVEITLGTGSGQIESITNIVNASGTYTVALSNAVGGAFLSSRARFQKWRVAGTITNGVTGYDQVPIETTSPWVQLKCIMYFTGPDELNYLQLINKSDIKPI